MEYVNLPTNESKHLADVLSRLAMSKKAVIDKQIADFIKSNKKYTVFEISESVILVLTKWKPYGAFLNVGFPFPIYKREIDLGCRKKKTDVSKIGINIHIRGEPVRKRQRMWIRDFIDSRFGNSEYKELQDVKEFRKITNSICRKKDLWIYVDPYDYIGDGFIGFHFLESFLNRFGRKETAVLSKSYNHMKSFYKTYPKSPGTFSKICKESTLVIMPDLIDNQMGRTISLIDSVKDKTLAIFLIGRNMIINIEKNKVKIFHYNEPDNLLRNKNIEDYMDDCLSPFLSQNESFQKNYYVNLASQKKTGGKETYFLNPFTSKKMKDIDVNLVLSICEYLVSEKDVRIYISGGLRKSEKDVKWVDAFLEKTSRKKHKHIMDSAKIIYFKDLSDVALKLEKFGVGVILTADTSISHLANRLGIPQITVYRKSFWNSDSTQSLTSDSPLGFCRYFNLQFPALSDGERMYGNNFSKLLSRALIEIHSISSCPKDTKHYEKIVKFHRKIHAFLRKKQFKEREFENKHTILCEEFNALKKIYGKDRLSWLFHIYDPCEMTKGILPISSKKTHHLIRTSWKISPIYKFFNLN